MEIKKEELYEFEFERYDVIDADQEPTDDPLSALYIKVEETINVAERETIIKHKIIPEATDNTQMVTRLRKRKEIERNINYNSKSGSTATSSSINNKILEHKSCMPNWKQRKYGLEESKVRRLRSRIRGIKTRLIAKLELPHGELEAKLKRDSKRNTLRRQAVLAKKTPEEIASLKKSQAERKRWVRDCRIATESVEEKALRIRKQREDYRHYRTVLLANETENKRAERKEKERKIRERFKQRQLQKSIQQRNLLNMGMENKALDQ